MKLCSERVREIAAAQTGLAFEESRHCGAAITEIRPCLFHRAKTRQKWTICLVAVRDRVVSDSKFKFEQMIRDSSSVGVNNLWLHVKGVGDG